MLSFDIGAHLLHLSVPEESILQLNILTMKCDTPEVSIHNLNDLKSAIDPIVFNSVQVSLVLSWLCQTIVFKNAVTSPIPCGGWSPSRSLPAFQFVILDPGLPKIIVYLCPPQKDLAIKRIRFDPRDDNMKHTILSVRALSSDSLHIGFHMYHRRWRQPKTCGCP